MVRVLLNDAKKYPRLNDYVQNELPEVPRTEPAVWAAFKSVSELNDDTATTILRYKHDGAPLLRIAHLQVKPGGYINGRFSEAKPTWIVLDRKIATRFESDYQLDKAKRLVQSVLLHELVHWAEFYRTKTTSDVELGIRFEEKAYGKNVHRYWTEPDRIPTTIAKDEADFALITNTKLFVERSAVFQTYVPRGLRNNNPGNIRIGPSDWLGRAPESIRLPVHEKEHSFEVFSSPLYGIRAMGTLLLKYKELHQLNTIAGLIERWAPGADSNDPEKYAHFVAEMLNVKPNTEIDFQDINTASKLVGAIITFENKVQPYSDDLIKESLNAAGYQ